MELLVVRRRGKQIEFLVAHRLGQHLDLQPVPFEGPRAESARLALQGQSGAVIGTDYRGERVIAGYEPVKGTDWAVIYKVDLKEVQGPFVRAALIGVLLDLGLVLLAAVLFVRLSDPLFQRLEESQQRFSALFHQSFNLQWTLKPDGTIVEANRTALDVAGVIVSAAVGKPFWETRWWPDTGALRDRLQAAVREAAEGTLARMEVEARGFGNRTVTLDLSLKPVTDRSGRVAMLSVEARDITARKQAEEALQRAEEKYRGIFENAVEGIYQTTPAGRFVTANPAMARMLGFESPEELIRERQDIGRTGYVDRQRRDEFKKVMAERGFTYGFEYEAYRKDGNRVWLSENARAVRDTDGSVLYYEGITENITERKQAERELAERTAFLHALIDNNPLAIVSIDPEERVQDCNPAFENLFGYRLEEMKGEAIDDFVAPGDLAAEALQLTRQAVRGEAGHAVAHRHRKDGSVINVEVHGVPLVVNGKLVGGFALYQDITERRRAEEEREKLVVELQEALANIKTLSGLLPICASCKKIRDDGGYWSQIESYISAHSQAQFSHGICPDCARQLYPEHYHKMFPELDGEKQTRD
ncbi:MAG: PAS domain S-box protein, partial [Candidatus Acidiferrales bacterium]